MDGVGGAVFYQEGEEGEDAANQKGNDDEVDAEEYCQTTTHDSGTMRYSTSGLRGFEGVGECQISRRDINFNRKASRWR